MSVIDRAIAAVTPPESEEARAEARKKAESIATPGDWLSQIINHHRGIESQFADLKIATSPDARRASLKKLSLLLTAHSVAEEVAVYPAMAANHEVGHAELAYQEQAAAKMEMGLLERLDPESKISMTSSVILRVRLSTTSIPRKEPGLSTLHGCLPQIRP
jgi:hemerythrin superfamily protein